MSTIPQNETTAPKDGGAVNIQPTKATADVAEQSTPVVVNEPNPGLSTKIEVQETTETSVDNSLSNTPAPSVNLVISPPKSTEELIAARALKRAARKTAVREKAEGHKRAVSGCALLEARRWLNADVFQGDILFETKNYKASYPQYLEAIQLWGSNPGYFISLAGAYRKLQWYGDLLLPSSK